jgi:hypothetical protein
MRAVVDALESANLVVQPVETENDFGRDAFVELVRDGDLTGKVIGIQVKSGMSHLVGGRWLIPGADSDFTLWRESSVPMFGMVWDPSAGAIRWVDLSKCAREFDAASSTDHPSGGTFLKGPYGKTSVVVPELNRLDLDPVPFIEAAMTACEVAPTLPTPLLLSDDLAQVEVGLLDCFALGRSSALAFQLVVGLFDHLPREAVPLAVWALAHATTHPDVVWTSDNWVSGEVKDRLHITTRWNDEDVSRLLDQVSHEEGLARGSVGQSVYHILTLDSHVEGRLFRVAVDAGRGAAGVDRHKVRFWAAAILLFRAGDDAHEVLRRLLSAAPDIRTVRHFESLIEAVREHGVVTLA